MLCQPTAQVDIKTYVNQQHHIFSILSQWYRDYENEVQQYTFHNVHIHTVHLDNYQSFFSPTDAQLDSLKNHFKFALKFT